MITSVDRETVQIYEEEIFKRILLYAKGKLTKDEAFKLAKEKVAKIDFNNEFMMHKSFEWFAETAVFDYLARKIKY